MHKINGVNALRLLHCNWTTNLHNFFFLRIVYSKLLSEACWCWSKIRHLFIQFLFDLLSMQIGLCVNYLKSPNYFGWLLVIVSVSRFLCSIFFFFVNSVVCVYTACTSVWIVPQNVETLAWEIIIFSFEIQKIRPQTFKAFRMNIFYTLFVMFFFLVPFSAVTDINDKVYTLRTIKFNEIFLEWIPSKCIKDQVVSLIQFYTHSVFRIFFLVPTSVHFLSVNGMVDLKKM